MSVIYKKINIKGSKNSREVTALFDSVASYSLIDSKIGEEIEMITPILEPMIFELASKNNFITVDKRIAIDFYIDDCRFAENFFLIDNLSEEIIIGSLTMQTFKFKLDFEHEDIIFNKEAAKKIIFK
jgi:hypothetical protein